MLASNILDAARAIAETLHITRPLCVLDTETTGVNVERDRVVELGVVTIAPDSIEQYRAVAQRWLINPTIPIPASASAIHGITDSEVAGCPTFAALARVIADVLRGCDLVGYNVRRFDVPILEAEFARAGVPWPCADARIIDPFLLFVRQEPRDLTGAMAFYCDSPVDPDEAHGALADVGMAIEVLAAQLMRYDAVLPPGVDGLHEFCLNRDPSWIDQAGKVCWRDGAAVLAVGKHAGRTLQDLAKAERAYLAWMLTAGFPDDTKVILKDALRGVFPIPTPEEART